MAAELRRAASAGFVLARNENRALPLDASQLGRVAVIGPNAATARTLGGGSATVYPPYTVSPLDGLREALDVGRVEHAAGVRASTRIPVADRPGVEVRFLAADGAVLGTEERPGAAFNWMGGFGPGVPSDRVARVEVHTTVRAGEPGTYEIGGSGVGRLSLSLNGEQVFDERLELAPGADVVEALMSPPQRVHPVELAAGEEVGVVLGYEVGSAGGDIDLGGAVFQLNLLPPHPSDDEGIERAVALARDAGAAVVVVGTTEEVESEGFDRTSLALPGRQDELVRRVAAANPRTIVVVNAGAPVLLPWADEVAAVLLAWFPGQEFGNALADVLLGAAEPGGRLPTTWPASEDRLPSTEPVDGVLSYDEGLFVGYRDSERDARYPFGHGLGYTTWEYRAIEAPDRLAPGEDVEVAVTVANTGDRRGREVVQVYAGVPEGRVERPARWLAGFATVDAEPGEELTVRIPVRARALEHWDGGGWTVEPGRFRLGAGPSSAALPVDTYVEVRD